MKIMTSLCALLLLTACAVGPDYVRPKVVSPEKYKEAAKGWKIAKPRDACHRGDWWKIFNDPQLNELENRLNSCNQNVALALAQYHQALAIVAETKAAFFPTMTATATVTRQKQSAFSPLGSGRTSASASTSNPPVTSHSLNLSASWEPDLWGSVRRQVEASTATAQASAAEFAVVQLSMQATLAQIYFLLRNLDLDQKILDNSVHAYKKAVSIAQNRYASGVDGRSDVVQAQIQLENAQATAINNKIARAQYEHAIAALIGQPASCFALAQNPLDGKTPEFPIQIPSQLLERRPDIAQAERLMAAANAQIGVAVSAFYPVLTLTAVGTSQGPGLGPWFSLPNIGWALGAALAETVFDGGLRTATVDAAKSNYNATVAAYRQTVLSAFQEVEDNLSTLRILGAEMAVQNRTVESSKLALKIVLNQYKAGTAALSDIIVAQNALYVAEKTAADILGQRMATAVGLVKALGGGWQGDLNPPL